MPARSEIEKKHPSAREKVDFLRQPSSYAEGPDKVGVKETHMSWVFMVNGFVYKLKKAVKYDLFDHRSLRSRWLNSKEEVRINQILAPDIYLGVLPLVLTQSGLQLSKKGKVVDWLVKMKRIPEELMLDHTLIHDHVDENAIRAAAKMLADFYKASRPAPISFHQFIKKIEDAIITNNQLLANPLFEISPVLIKEITAGQLAYLASHRDLFRKRSEAKKIIDAHGDLRPEHICLGSRPVIIDRLEFSQELRIMDVAEELAFLSMECEVLGNKLPGDLFLQVYVAATGDLIPRSLTNFYKIKKACTRAYLVARHIEEAAYRKDPKWLKKAQAYLQLAEQYHQAMIT